MENKISLNLDVEELALLIEVLGATPTEYGVYPI